MNRQEKQAIKEVIDGYFTPDSPEAFAGAIYQLKRIYENETRRQTPKLRPQTTSHAEDPAIGAHRAASRQQAPHPLQAARNLSGRVGDGED
jgi:hypothetical protein